MRTTATLLVFMLLAVSQCAFGQTNEIVGSEGDNDTLEVAGDTSAVDDMVVTSLGLRRDKKTLPYSFQQITGDEMMKANDINFMNLLSGKIAGMEIKKAASGPGGSTRVIIRGSRSLNDASDPLYVIDGMPVVNRRGSQPGMWGGVDEGDGLSQLNPDDIESISVLKGSNAAFLYGTQGSNGVILITTRKAAEGTMDIRLSNATTFERPLILPEFQYKYGSSTPRESWSNTPLSHYDDKFIRDFFQTGHNVVNNVSFSKANNGTTTYFSYANTTAKGIIPTNEYLKNNITFRQSAKFLNDKLTVGSNLMLTSERAKNRPSSGYYLNPLTGLYFFPRQGDFSSYKEKYEVYDPSRRTYFPNWFIEDHHQSNPYWILHNEPREDGAKRIIASANIEWDIANGLKFQVRGTYDYADKVNEQRHKAGSNGTNVSSNGRWYYRKYTDWLSYVDGILSYDTDFGDFSLNALVGASYQQNRYANGVSVDNGTIPLSFPNSLTLMFPDRYGFYGITADFPFSQRNTKSGSFVNVQLGYKEMIYIDLCGRNDKLPAIVGEGKDSHFSPAIGLNAIISRMINLPGFITFGKLRGSYSTVANDFPFNTKLKEYGQVTRVFSLAPFFDDAKPGLITSIETGTEWRLMKGRLGIDFTYYHVTSADELTLVPSLPGAGYTHRLINAGNITNKGIELTVDAEPVMTTGFSWRTALNFAKNKNVVEELFPDDPGIRITLGSAEGYYNFIQTGGSFGDLYIRKFVRDDQGRIMLDDRNRPLINLEPKYIGSLNPDFILGWNNSFIYRRFSMVFLINGVFGGNVMSQTESMLDGYGVSKRTADARDAGGVTVNAVDPAGNPVTKIDAYTWYSSIGNRNGIGEAYVYDRTNIRLTQFSLAYNIDVKSLKLPLKSASVALVGQNLFFLYNNAPYDPELTMSTGINSQGLDNFNVPATRTYGFNIKINF